MTEPDTPTAELSSRMLADPDAEDIQVLEKMGYKQELMRGFDGFMSFAFCFTSVAVMSSISISWGSIVSTGGPDTAVYCWLVASVSTIMVGLAMAEICSVFPSAGSVYHWAGMLAPAGTPSAVASYICGWFNFLGNAAGDASFAWGFASVIGSAIQYSTWDPVAQTSGTPFTNQQTVGVAILVCFVWACLNVLKIDQQGWINNFAAGWQVVTTVAIVICVLNYPPQDPDIPSNWIWTTNFNSTGFDDSNIGYVALLGLLYACFAFSGYEAGAHLAEETHQASVSSPRGLVATCCVSALVGLIYIVGMLYATPASMGQSVADFITANPGLGLSDYLSAALANVAGGGAPYVYMVACATKGSGTGMALIAVLVINVFFAGISSLTVTSRIAFAMARDGALPASEWIRIINPVTKAPIGTVVLVFVLDALILLLGLRNAQSFYAITSITVIGYQISYFLPIFLRITWGRKDFKQGAFSLGKYSMAIHCYAAFWLLFTSLIFFWPFTWPLVVGGPFDNMNWTVVVVGATMVVAGAYWFAVARHSFKGPRARVAATEASKLLPDGAGGGYGGLSVAVRDPTSTASIEMASPTAMATPSA